MYIKLISALTIMFVTANVYSNACIVHNHLCDYRVYEDDDLEGNVFEEDEEVLDNSQEDGPFSYHPEDEPDYNY